MIVAIQGERGSYDMLVNPPEDFVEGGANSQLGVPISYLHTNPHIRCHTTVHGYWYVVDSWAQSIFYCVKPLVLI